MKPEELRIGNYVLVDWNNEIWGHDEYYPDFQETVIVEITKDHIVDIHDECYNIERDVKPIPLTKDWLYEFAAHQFGNYYSFEINELSRLTIYQIENKFGFELQLIDPETGDDVVDSFVPLEIDSTVHALQNLMKVLTGKELVNETIKA